MSDRLEEILREWFFDSEPLTELDNQEMFLLAEAKQALQSYIDTKIIDILEYLSEQAIEYGITDAERYAWHHKGEADPMMIPVKAVKEALNYRKEK